MWNEIVGNALDGTGSYKLLVAYQPLASLENLSDPIYFEALARLRSPGGEIYPAGFFIDSIIRDERTMLALDWWMLEKSARRIKRSGQRITLNVTAWSLRAPYYAQKIANSLSAEGVALEKLALELSESSPIGYREALILKHLSQNHLVMLDDVGSLTSRHSLFGYLTYPWVRGVKLDKSLIQGLKLSGAQGDRTQVVIRSLLNCCAALNLGCVVEGVEAQEQIDWLLESKPQNLKLYCQGWAVGKPEVDYSD